MTNDGWGSEKAKIMLMLIMDSTNQMLSKVNHDAGHNINKKVNDQTFFENLFLGQAYF